MTPQELMLTEILDCQRAELYTKEVCLTPAQQLTFDAMQQRFSRNEPLQYILGQTHFFGFPFKVDSRVLIPRPETELLVESLLDFVLRYEIRDLRILDVGTGSGNIAIALAKSLSGARIVAMDISEDALKVGRENARCNGVSSRIDFVHCDAFEFFENYRQAEKGFDIIVSNPPYIATPLLASLPADVRQEPQLALDGGPDGLKFYRVLIEKAKRFLKDHAVLACEIGDGQKEALGTLLGEHGFENVYFKNDYRDTPRYFLAQV